MMTQTMSQSAPSHHCASSLPSPPRSPVHVAPSAQRPPLKRKIRAFTFESASGSSSTAAASSFPADPLDAARSPHHLAPHQPSARDPTSSPPSSSHCLVSPSCRPTPVKQPRVVISQSSPCKSRSLMAEFQQLPQRDPCDALPVLPPPPGVLAPVPRHFLLHQHLVQQLQSDAPPASLSPSPLFTLPAAPSSLSSSANSSPLSSTSPPLADAFPPLPPLPVDAEPAASASLPHPLVAPDSPPFRFISQLLSPRRPALPLLLTSLSPDPKAFAEQRELRKKTPRQTLKLCPPTPMRLNRPAPLQRHSSLYDTKMLADDVTPMAADAPPAAAAAEAESGSAASPQSKSSSVFVSSPVSGTPVTFESHFSSPVLVGEGSFFQVFRAVSVLTGETVAVKRSLRVFRGKKDREGYMREVEMRRTLGFHPHILRVQRAWQEELHFYIQMEYLPHTLEQWAEMQSRTAAAAAASSSPSSVPLSASLLFLWLSQLCLALRHIHARGVVHLDIKPENVLVSERGLLKLGDFGSARGVAEVGDGSEGDSRYAAAELFHVQMAARKSGENTETEAAAAAAARRGSLGSCRAEQTFLHPPRTLEAAEAAAGQSSFSHLLSVAAPSCPSTPSFLASTVAATPSTSALSSPRSPPSSFCQPPFPQCQLTSPSASAATASLSSSPSSFIIQTRIASAFSSSSSSVSFGTDIFSLGLMLLELASSIDLPKDGAVWHELREGRAAQHVRGKLATTGDEAATELLEDVILSCLCSRVDDRPTAEDILLRIRPQLDRDALESIGVTLES